MNKIVYLFGLLFIALTSCSGDDDQPTLVNLNPDTLLLQKTVTKNYSLNGGTPYTTLWNYNGMKLSATSVDYGSGAIIRSYTYTGNLITKVVEVQGGSSVTTIYAYDDQQRLVSASGTYEIETFTYNNDGTVSDVLTNANSGDVVWTASITLSGNEIGSIVRDYPDGLQTIHEYTYDNKYAPTKNIIGFAKLCLSRTYSVDYFRNVVSRMYSDNEGIQGQVQRTISYNAIGFPVITHSEDDQFIDSFDTQFFYQ